MKFTILSKSDGSKYAKIKRKDRGGTFTQTEPVEILEEKVREGLHSDSNLKKLNIAERYIAFTMDIVSDPELGRYFTAGLDLKKVRSAKLYLMGDPTLGATRMALIEAKDENNELLGTFFSSLFIAPCQ